MLQKIRDRVSGWISIVIFTLVGAAFVLFGVEYYFQQGGSSADTVAKVNGVVISRAMLSETVAMLAKKMGGTVPEGMQNQLNAYALESLVTQTALLTTLQKEGFHIGLPEMKALVMQAPEFQEDGHFSPDKFNAILSQMGETPFAFMQRIQSQFLVNQAMQGVGESALVLPVEVNQYYAGAHESRAFGYFLISAQTFLPQAVVSAADIQKYYDDQKDLFKTPEKVLVSYVLLSPAAIVKTVSVSPTEIKQYYDTHKENFTVPARWIVSQITIPVAADASADAVKAAKTEAESIFAQLSQHKKMSVGSQTLTLSDAGINSALRSVVSQLKVGMPSQPIRTQNGFTVLTVQKAEPASIRPFSAVQKDILNLLQHEQVNQILTQQTSKLSDLAYANPDSLQPVVDALHVPLLKSGLLTKAGEKTGVFADPNVMKAIFSDAVLQSHNNSNVITLQDGSQLVLRVEKNIPSESIPLSTVQDQIKKTLMDQRAAAKAGVLAYQLQTALLAGEKPESLAQKNHVSWHAVPLTVRATKSVVPQSALETIFNAPVSDPLKNGLLNAQSVAINSHDYVVFGVTQVKKADPATASPAAIQSSEKQLSEVWQALFQKQFVASVIEQSRITVKQS